MEKKNPLLEKNLLIKDYEHGGLKAIDFECIDGMLQIMFNVFGFAFPEPCLKNWVKWSYYCDVIL